MTRTIRTMPSIRSLTALALAFTISTMSAACGHQFGRTDLDIALSKHHIDLRWGRIENAAQKVDPELRAAFLAEWLGRAQEIELQDLDISGVAMADDGASADVVVTFTYVERASMTVRQVQVVEKWVRTSDGWLAKKPATLDAQKKADGAVQPAPNAAGTAADP